MDPVSLALAAWIDFNTELGVDLRALLRPGASENQIIAVEDAIGQRLPDDLRALYRLADGQLDLWDPDAALPTDYDGERVGAMFGHFLFLPLDAALAEYRNQQSIHEDAPPNPEYVPWGYRSDDPIDPVDWQSTWFPFAGGESGNGYAVDLAPPRGGTIGQIVQVGPDVERLLVAESVTALLEGAARHLDVDQPGRFTLDDGNGYGEPRPPSVEFDMNWRWTPPVPPTAEELARWQTEAAALEAAYVAERNSFLAWLLDTGRSDAEARAVLNAIESSPALSDALGPARQDAPSFIDPVASMLDQLDITLYQHLIDGRRAANDGVSLAEAADALARWRVATGGWSAEQYAKARRILDKPRMLPPGTVLREDDDEASFGYAQRNADGSVTIGDSRLDAPVVFD